MIKVKVQDDKQNLYYNLFKHLELEYEWQLNTIDLKVLSILYFKDSELIERIIAFTERQEVLFSTRMKKDCAKELEISYAAFNNSLTKIRKKGFIEDNKLNKKYIIDIKNQPVQLIIEFFN